MDAQRLINLMTGGFTCERCKTELVEEDNTKRVNEAQQKKATMLQQLRKITDLLKGTEGMVIPRISLQHLHKAEDADKGAAAASTGSRTRHGTLGYLTPLGEPTVLIDFGNGTVDTTPAALSAANKDAPKTHKPTLGATARPDLYGIFLCSICEGLLVVVVISLLLLLLLLLLSASGCRFFFTICFLAHSSATVEREKKEMPSWLATSAYTQKQQEKQQQLQQQQQQQQLAAQQAGTTAQQAEDHDDACT